MKKQVTAIRAYKGDRNKFNKIVKRYNKLANFEATQQDTFEYYIEALDCMSKGGKCKTCTHQGCVCNTATIVVVCEDYVEA